jgi:hypothetical protein
MRILLSLALGAALSGCVTAKIDQPFNAAEGAFIHKQGTGRIEGSAFLRQRGGGTVTAAGNDITLIPVTSYSSARFAALYKGQKSSYFGGNIEGTPEGYYTQTKKTKADVEGRFIFDGLHPGDYFLTTEVRWQIPGSDLPEGAFIYERVSVKNGETARVVMSGN